MKAPRLNPIERDRQRTIYEYLLLKYPEGFWWRSEPAGAFTRIRGKVRPLRGGDITTPGVPDLMGLYRGQCIGIEVKRERNRTGEPEPLRASQIDFCRRFDRAGGRYIVATDIDDVDEALRPF